MVTHTQDIAFRIPLLRRHPEVFFRGWIPSLYVPLSDVFWNMPVTRMFNLTSSPLRPTGGCPTPG
jgi:hypothetical protein